MIAIVLAIIGFIIGMALVERNCALSDIDSNGLDFLMGFMFMCVGGIIGCILQVLVLAPFNKPEYKEFYIKDTPIYSLETVSDETFILGTGGTSDKIYYYTKDEGGLYSINSAPVNIKIKLDDTMEPCLREEYCRFKSNILNIINFGDHVEKRYLILPSNSIKRNFEITQ